MRKYAQSTDRNEPDKSANSLSSATQNPLQILLLDDDTSILEPLAKIIEKAGYRCMTCNNAQEAISLIETANPSVDIFITDYLMVGITAVQVVEEIRTFNQELYIILLTGYAQNMPPMYAIKNLDIDSYSEKDSNFQDLLLKIEIAARSLLKNRSHNPSTDGLSFHEKLKKLRTESNLTQDDIARYIGVGRTTVVNYEQGRIKPTLENIRKLAILFKVSVDSLLDSV